MQVKVDLQNPFTYNEKILSTIIVIGISLFFIVIAIFIIKKYHKQIIRLFHHKKYQNLKSYYLEKLTVLEEKYKNNQSNLRDTSVALSLLVRNFVKDETDVDVSTLSKEEIKKLDIPKIYEIIDILYHPEFAKYSEDNIDSIFSKAKEVIKSWK